MILLDQSLDMKIVMVFQRQTVGSCLVWMGLAGEHCYQRTCERSSDIRAVHSNGKASFLWDLPSFSIDHQKH